MTAKVGSSAVSYGIGVQNRYSAFLEDEDGIVLSSIVIASANSMKRPNDGQSNSSNKQKGSLSGSQKSASSKVNGRTETSAGASKKNDAQQKSLNLINGQQKQVKGDFRGSHQRNGKPQQPQPQLSGAKTIQAPRQGSGTGKPGNFSQDGQMTNNNNKVYRNQANGNSNHQPNVPQQPNKENETSAGLKSNTRVSTNNQRFNRPRQFQTEDRKSGQQDGQVNANGPQTSEEEKRRRQKKRALDLKHKDPEKRESRRNQTTGGSGEQVGLDNQADNQGDGSQRGQRNRRDRVKGADEIGPKTPRVRGPRTMEGEPNGERREGQQGVRRGDRPPRNRNGFGAGSRGSHGSRGENKNQEKPKPIPNFSDKSDFPSLAS